MSTHEEDRLRTALRTQAGRGEPQPVDLETVRGTARRIRRRRAATAVLSTAAVVALAVPAGLAVTGGFDNDATPPVAGSPDPSPTMTAPERLVEVSLLDDAQPGGDQPALAYLSGDEIVLPDGGRLTAPGEGTPRSLALLGDSWLVLMDIGDGNYTLDTVTATGELEASVPARGAPALSDDGEAAAYLSADGDVHVITQRDGDVLLASADQVGDASQVVGVAVADNGSCKETEGGGCTVYVNLGPGGARYVNSHGMSDDVAPFRKLADATFDRVLGTVSASDFGSCSVLQDGGKQVWRTCDNSFGMISPDGRYAMGYPAYFDGLGPKSVSIVDMADGRELVRFADEGMTDTTVTGAVWESDTSLLLTVWDGEDRSWSILRAGIDGSLEEAVTGLPGDIMDETAVHLPVR